MSGWRLLVAIGGLIVWSSAFVVLYAALSLGCEAGLQLQPLAGTNALTVLLTALWVAHLAALAGMQWYALALWRHPPAVEPGLAQFMAATTCLIAAVGLISTFVTGVAIIVLPPCTRVPLWL